MKKKTKKRSIIFLTVITAFVAFRLLLPSILLKFVNQKLANLTDYYGHVEDIDIHLYRGAYVIKDIRIVKIEEKDDIKKETPFFKSPSVDFSVQWKALIHGKVVGEVDVKDPVVNFVKGKHQNENLETDHRDFKTLMKSLMPLTINHFNIFDGTIHYIDKGSKPKVYLTLKDVQIEAQNLSNVTNKEKKLPSKLLVYANAYEGDLSLRADFDGLAEKPTFDFNSELKNLNLVLLNDFLQAYGNFDVKKGRVGIYSEFAGEDGGFRGYVKPLIKDLDVVQWNSAEGNLGQVLWEALIGSSAELLQNQKTETIASKIPISGKFENPNIGVWSSISYVLRNAFVHALKPAIDNSINFRKIAEDEKKGLIEKLFNKKKSKNEKVKK